VIDYYNKKKREQALFAQTDFDLVEKLHQHEESQQQDVKDYEILEEVIKNQGNKDQVEQSKALFSTWGQKYLPADMKACLEALSEAHRNIILAREVLGYNYSDISVTFAIKEGTVMSRLSRARKALKDQLDEYNSNQ
jgi:RNA polymerase sigma-70 factor (ECF subfamily)